MTAKMIKRLTVVCGKPESIDVPAYLAEFTKIVGKNWSDEVLDEATDTVLKARTYPGWPTPGECRKACEEAAERQRKASHRTVYSVAEPGAAGPVDQEQAARVQALVDGFKRSVAEKTIGEKKPALRSVSRPSFEAMQESSPNDLHSWRGKR
jgi:hypothetical protein